MTFNGITKSYDLSTKFKETIDLKKTDENIALRFSNDIKGQVVYDAKGSDIVVTAYNTQKVSYQMVQTFTDPVKIKKGKYKGKYKCDVVTYRAVVDEDGNVTGYEDSPASVKTKYVKKVNDTITFEQLNSKGKVIQSSATTMEGYNTTVVDKDSVMGTLTFKNGANSDKEILYTSDNNKKNVSLLNEYYTPAKKKNTYTGSWMNETIASTSKNETFNLAGGHNIIQYDLSQKQGKDKIGLVKNGEYQLDMSTTEGLTFRRSNNNIIISSNSSSASVSGDNYTMVVVTIEEHEDRPDTAEDKYTGSWDEYEWNSETNRYDKLISQSPQQWTKAGFLEVKDSMHYEIGENIFYFDDKGNMITGKSSATTQITLKNYLKNEVDNVTLYDEGKDENSSLKTVLENTQGVGYFGSKTSKKKQTLNGTFLNEHIYSGTKNDKIKTGTGNDIIYISKGNDKVTVNGNGKKTLDYEGDTLPSGNTTVSFSKGLTYGLDAGKTSLDVSKIYQSEASLGGGFIKSGNDLILDSDAMVNLSKALGKNSPSPTYGSKVTIKDFFKNENVRDNTIFAYDDEEAVTINDLKTSIIQIGNAKKSNKISDTVYQDTLIGGKKSDTFTISHGNASVVTNTGNDKINVTKDAEGTLNINTIIGNGSDTLTIDKDLNVETIVDGYRSNTFGDNEKVNLSFEKSGNDLIFNTKYLKGETFGLTKDVTNTLTVKNYFAEEYNLDVDFVYGYDDDEEEYLMGSVDEVLAETDKLLKINSVYNKKTKTYNYTGTDMNDEFTYGGKNKAVMTDALNSVSNDKYNLTVGKTSNLKIYDGGGNDSVVFTNDISDLRLFFNVTVQNKGDEYTSSAEQKLQFFDKRTLTAKNAKTAYNGTGLVGAVEFTNFNARAEESSFAVYDKNENINVNEWANYVQSEVAAWLNTSKYNSTAEVLNSKDTTSINQVIAIYTNSSYDFVAV